MSTTEAKYIALSQSLRDVIPLRTIINEVSNVLNPETRNTITHSTIFEDNNGAIDLAVEPKYRPRTKHMGIKYHHFRQHVRNKTIWIRHIDTNGQIADIMTKPLERGKFEYLRKR